MRKTTVKLLLLVGSIAATVLVLELVLAVFLPQRTLNRLSASNPNIFEASELLPYRLIPNATARLAREEFDTTIRINSQGYRGAEFDPDDDETFRILVVGDSFTFGFGVNDDETYSASLQEALGTRYPERRVEVINGGYASGYYPDTYYLYLREIAPELSPDLALIGFFVGNDIDHDRVDENVWIDVDPDGLPAKIRSRNVRFENGHRVPSVIPRRYRYPILRNSHVAQALAPFLSSTRRADPREYFNQWIYRAEYADRTNRAVERVQTLLLASSRVTARAGIPMVVVMIPAREQLYPDDYPFERHPHMTDRDLEKPQRIFAEFFAANGIEYIDLLPALEAEARTAELYFPADQHWNRVGNETAGRLLADALRDELLETDTAAAAAAERVDAAL